MGDREQLENDLAAIEKTHRRVAWTFTLDVILVVISVLLLAYHDTPEAWLKGFRVGLLFGVLAFTGLTLAALVRIRDTRRTVRNLLRRAADH